MCAVYIPFFQHIFKTENLGFYDLLTLVLVSSSVLIVDEIRKAIYALARVNEPVYSSEV